MTAINRSKQILGGEQKGIQIKTTSIPTRTAERIGAIDQIPPHYVKAERPSFLFSPQMMNWAEDKQSGAPIDASIYNMKITCEVRERQKQTDNPTVSPPAREKINRWLHFNHRGTFGMRIMHHNSCIWRAEHKGVHTQPLLLTFSLSLFFFFFFVRCSHSLNGMKKLWPLRHVTVWRVPLAIKVQRHSSLPVLVLKQTSACGCGVASRFNYKFSERAEPTWRPQNVNSFCHFWMCVCVCLLYMETTFQLKWA